MIRHRFALALLSLSLALTACSDDTKPPRADAKPAADLPPAVDEAVTDQAPTADRPPTTGDKPGGKEASTADLPRGKERGSDLPRKDGPQKTEAGPPPPPNSTCAKAQAITLTGGKVSVTGTTAGAADEFPTLECGGYSTLDGAQVYYSISFAAGKTYKLTIKPSFSSAYLYLFSSSGGCSVGAIETYCASNGATGDVLGSVSANATASLFFSPTTTDTFVIGIDSSSTTSGSFVLDIEEVTPPANATCATAKALTLTAGKATATGSTGGAKNEFSNLVCGGFTKLSGPQVYYSFTAGADKGYRLTLTPSFYAHLFVFSSAASCGEAGIETDCGSSGATGDEWGPSSSKLAEIFVPSKPGTYYIAVDSSSSSDAGGFTLDLEEFDLPTNSTCAKAQAVTMTGGSATVTGSTDLGTKDEFPNLKCGGSTLEGPQLYYKIDLVANRTYRLRLSPKFSAYLYVFPGTANCQEAQIEAACASKGATGDLLASVSSGTSDSLYFKVPADGSYVIAVDSTWDYNAGDFSLAIDEMTAATNATCAAAKALTFTAGAALVEGDTYGGTDQFATLKCGLTSALAGPQLYYKIDLTQGVAYAITLSTAFDGYLVVFSSTAACAVTGIDTDCASKGATGDVLEVDASTKNLVFTPATTGTYYLAVDSTANTAGNFGWFRLQVKQPPAMPSFTAPFSWDFETTCQQLYATNDWECGKLGTWVGDNCDSTDTPPTAGHTGTGMWGTKLNSCYSPLANADASCNNADLLDDSVLGFKVSIPAGWTTAELSYWAYDDYYLDYDWAEVRINGKQVQQFCTIGSVPEPPVWTKRTVDLKAYVGQTITVQFHFMATGVINYSGWYIDDLAVSGQ